MPQAPHEQDADSRAQRTNRGCWIALAATAAVMTALAVVAVIVVTRLIEDSPIPEWGKRVGEGADIILDAQANPTSNALRHEGCGRGAMFLDVERVLDLVASLDDAGAFERPANAPTHLALCLVERGASLPSCHDLARVVAQKGATEGDFAVSVSEGSEAGASGGSQHCAERYDRGGTHLEGYDPSTVPMPQ